MLKRLTNLYGVPFSKNAAGALIMAMLGRLGTGTPGGVLFFTAVKVVPGAWPLLALVSRPIVVAAVTYALGNVFIAHLEVGGVLQDFDPEANREHFKNLITRGRQIAKALSRTPGY